MKRILFCLLLLPSLFAFSNEPLVSDTTDTGFLSGAALPAKILAARHEYNENNMRGALTIYREVLKVEPDNSTALYWTAKCHYKLKKYGLAKEYLDKAVSLDPKVQNDIDYFYGLIYHRNAELDLAIESYNKFLATEPNKRSLQYEQAVQFVAQCHYAKELMAKPIKVEVTNMGKNLNSRYDDYAPSITADGKMIVFTSRRADSKGGDLDEGGDYKFFEDVYYSEWNEENGEWSNSYGVEGYVNTPTYDAVLSISPDGQQMFIYKNNVKSQGDIFSSSYLKTEMEWTEPKKLPRPVNTSYFESSASITADGKKLFFISERPDGNGQGDIYMSEKSGSSWGKPKNLGPKINTYLDEKFVFIHPNGKTMYFASNGHQTMGGYDIFKTEFVNGQWSLPINLGYPINTVNEESTFSLTSDNNTLLIAAEYDDSYGERDIYLIDVSNYPLISAGYEHSNYGTVILTVQDGDGERIKNATVNFRNQSGNRIILSETTDKLGRLKVNLPGNASYSVSAEYKDGKGSVDFDLPLSGSGETVVNYEITIP